MTTWISSFFNLFEMWMPNLREVLATPQFDEVAQLVMQVRKFETSLSEDDVRVFGEGTFCYSDKLKEETRKVIYDMPVGRDDYLYFKNWDGSFGKMNIFDLMKNKLLIKDSNIGAEFLYKSDDELIEAGWVTD